MNVHPAGGLSVTELLAVIALAGLALMATIPSAAGFRASALTAAGARELAVTLQAQRSRAAADGRAHGLLFGRDDRGWFWHVARDGNGNGLRASEIRVGIDPTLSGPHRLEDRMYPVRLGFPELGSIPRIPPARGHIRNLADPVRIGNTDLLTFSPLGTATSGTVYVSDGDTRLYGVVVFGSTGRIRVWRFVPEEKAWVL